MNTIARGIIGLSAIGSVVGGGFAASHYLSTDNIESKLKANGYQLLDKGSADWNAILTSYSKSSSLKFEGFDGTTSGSSTNTKPVDVLKQKCEEALKFNLSKKDDKDLYKKAEKWCIKPQSVVERLKYLGFEKLDTTTANPEGDKDDAWDTKLSEHKVAKENKLAEITTDIEKKPNKEQRPVIKKACAEIFKKKTYEQEYEDSLAKAKLWCSNETEKTK
ncbi:hypothetical protein A6V39_00050 [Candidatus Mycoplasma haematobovis]|uniref:Uncharacterized protein n=1 Tax=Candidatus Mycoplasma haematobovis TaxID=432608 RepID=A0A1A9QFG8_9MOLU|nr:hypothetical protein [Candidatus Mycoplasma haematobovis]OAL10440.1 hypothetical protein A6V39_00050 [Candidatus Mycoplasma haematobovis]